MAKHTGVHPYHGLLPINKKEQIIDTHNLGGSQEYYAERKKPIMYCMIPFIEHSQNDQIIDMEGRLVVVREMMSGRRWVWLWKANMKEFFVVE